MKATAIVKGKVITFMLAPGLAAAHRRHTGERMSEAEAVAFVEAKRRTQSSQLETPRLARRS